MKARTEEEEKQEEIRSIERWFVGGCFTLRHLPAFEGFSSTFEKDFTGHRVVEGSDGNIWLQGSTGERDLTLTHWAYSNGSQIMVQGHPLGFTTGWHE